MSKQKILDELYAGLIETYPVLKEFKPLAIGVFDEILILVHDPAIARAVLSHHTRNIRYLKALSNEPLRYHLDGTEAGEVVDEHRAYAAQQVSDRTAQHEKKQADKKAAKKTLAALVLAKKQVPKKPVKATKPEVKFVATAPKIIIKKRRLLGGGV